MASQDGQLTCGLFPVLEDDLTLAVGAQPRHSPVFAHLCHPFTNFVGQEMGVWMQELRIPLVSGIAKDEALVTCTPLLDRLVTAHRISNTGTLPHYDLGQNTVGSIETIVFTGEATVEAGLSRNLLIVYSRSVLSSTCLADKDQLNSVTLEIVSRRVRAVFVTYIVTPGDCFEPKDGVRVSADACINDSVRDLVTQLVRVALADRFRSEQE